MVTDLSDHLPVFQITQGRKNPTNSLKVITCQSYTENNKLKFKELISVTNWNDVIIIDNPDCSYGLFITKFGQIYDTCFPLKEVRLKKKSIMCPG